MDTDLRKAIGEVQFCRIDTAQKVGLLDMKIDMIKTGKNKYILTEKGTSDLPDDAKVYLSVGRMFVFTDVTNMRNDLKAKQEKCDKALELLTKRREIAQQNLQENEDKLREMLIQKRDAGSKDAPEETSDSGNKTKE